VSYILEALKRSEQERHQGELTPTAVDTIMFKPKQVKHHWWPYLLILVLLINLGVYVYFQTLGNAQTDKHISAEQPATQSIKEIPVKRSDEANTSTMMTKQGSNLSSHTPDASTLTPVKALPEHVLQSPSLNRQFNLNQLHTAPADKASDPMVLNRQKLSNQEAVLELNADGFEVIRPKQGVAMRSPMQNQTDEIQGESPDSARIEIPQNYELIEPANANTPKAINSENGITEINADYNETDYFETIAHLNDLPSAFQASIPDIRFNSHIYSLQQAERRVMINDFYLKEGQSFSGMKIQRIGEFYIELEKQGQHFKLPVLRDWFSPK
jgi:general secretion pathway protein B